MLRAHSRSKIRSNATTRQISHNSRLTTTQHNTTQHDNTTKTTTTTTTTTITYSLTSMPSSSGKEAGERSPAPDVGDGWTVMEITRQSGKSAGHKDKYWFSPGGKRFRSKAEISRFQEALEEEDDDDEDKAWNKQHEKNEKGCCCYQKIV